MSKIPVVNMSKGELAPELYSRIDTSQYGGALKRALNWVVQKFGGVRTRPGTRYIGDLDEVNKNARLFPFQYALEQAYVIAAQDGIARPLSLGGFVLEEDSAGSAGLKITAATKAVNCQLTVAFHDYAVGDRVFITGVEGMTELNGRLAKVVSVVDANNITIDIDSRGYGTFTTSTGIVRTGAPPPPPPPPSPPSPPPPPPPPPPVGGGGGDDLFPGDGTNPIP